MKDANDDLIERHDVVQITDEEHPWFPALLIVDETKVFGFQGYLWVVDNSQNQNGQAYIRINSQQYVKIGKLVLIPRDLEL